MGGERGEIWELRVSKRVNVDINRYLYPERRERPQNDYGKTQERKRVNDVRGTGNEM